MGAFIAILTSRLAGPIATGAALLFLLLAISQCTGRISAEHARDEAQKAQAAAEADYRTCQANEKTLADTITQQSAAVDAMKAQSDADRKASAAALGAARAATAKERNHVQALLNAKPASADLCESADALILQEAGR